jgi:peptidoglycan/LPS O-acetylase OafA/YrhL
MEQTHGRGRLREFDLLRGAAIILVVYLHAYFTPWPEASHDSLLALRAAHLVAHGAVPLFLFIAAYLQASGPREGVGAHLRRRWWSTWLPVLVWMGATLAYRIWDQGIHGTLWRDLALFDIAGQFYFAWLLLFFGVLLTQARRVPDRWLWAMAGLAFAANLAAIAWYEQRDAIGGLFANLAYRNPLVWVFFPVLGYALGRRGIPHAAPKAVYAAVAVMAVAAAIHLVRGARTDEWPVSYFGVTVFLFSAAAMFVYPSAGARLLGIRALAAPLTWLSRYAFPIYLVHLPFVIGFGTERLLGDGADWSNYWLLLHANAAVGLFGSLAFVWAVDKTSPWLARRILGVRRIRNGRRLAAGRGAPSPSP